MGKYWLSRLYQYSQLLLSVEWMVKVTVQYETEGNGQNKIVSHMDRSGVKL